MKKALDLQIIYNLQLRKGIEKLENSSSEVLVRTDFEK